MTLGESVELLPCGRPGDYCLVREIAGRPLGDGLSIGPSNECDDCDMFAGRDGVGDGDVAQ